MTNKGFTLIEVLIAFVIVAVGLTTIIASSSQFTRGSAHIKSKIAANISAQNYLDELRTEKLIGKPLVLNSTAGTFKQGGYTLPYSVDITPAALPELKNITVQVKTPEGKGILTTLNAYMMTSN